MSARRPIEAAKLLKEYLFSLQPLHPHCRLDKVALNFAPDLGHHLSYTPTYYPHSLEMLPCFVPPALPFDQDDHLHFANQIYVRRAAAAEKSFILEPKPRKGEFCAVCKEAYRDYRTHILHQEHKRAIRQSPFHRHILKLVRKVRKEAAREEEQPQAVPNKRKPIVKGGRGVK